MSDRTFSDCLVSASKVSHYYETLSHYYERVSHHYEMLSHYYENLLDAIIVKLYCFVSEKTIKHIFTVQFLCIFRQALYDTTLHVSLFSG